MIFMPSSKLVGTWKVRKLMNSSGIAPNMMNGRNLPHRVMVRSTIRPASRSANASHSRTTRNMVPTAAAEMPATSV